MNKSELIERMTDQAGISKAAAGTAQDADTEAIEIKTSNAPKFTPCKVLKEALN